MDPHVWNGCTTIATLGDDLFTHEIKLLILGLGLITVDASRMWDDHGIKIPHGILDASPKDIWKSSMAII